MRDIPNRGYILVPGSLKRVRRDIAQLYLVLYVQYNRPLLLRIADNNNNHVPAEIIGNLVDLRADVRSAGKITTM